MAETKHPAHMRDTIVEVLRGFVAAVAEQRGDALPKNRIDAAVNLLEAGYVDSLSASEFLVMAEQHFQVAIPDWLLGGPKGTLQGLAGFIAENSH